MSLVRRLVLPLLLLAVAVPALAERRAAPSDPDAVRLAKRVLKAMGGRDAFNETRYVAWNFYGMRFHVWDRFTGDLRTDATRGYQILMNVRTGKGRAWRDGVELEGEELADVLQKARSSWINDSYWWAMPFKLLDDGVRLRGPRKILQPDGDEALAIHVTFDGVGDTPWNGYDVHVDPRDNVVNGWGYYPVAGDREPLWELPWILERRGKLLLPVSHGRPGDFEINVFDDVPRSIFTERLPRLNMAALLELATPIPPQEPEF